MRITHPEHGEMDMPNTTTSADWAKANGWTIDSDDDVELLDPSDHDGLVVNPELVFIEYGVNEPEGPPTDDAGEDAPAG